MQKGTDLKHKLNEYMRQIDYASNSHVMQTNITSKIRQ